MKRHILLSLVALVGCGCVLTCTANAQSPTRPIGQPFDAVYRPADSFGALPRFRPISLDKQRFMGEREAFLRPEVRDAFPFLGDDFEVIGPASDKYNAVSHALGIYDRWLSPMTGPAHAILSDMDKLCADHGFYRLATMDLSLEPAKEKIVVYMSQNADGSWKEVTSMALQEADGSWSSKPGKLAPIRHRTADALRGTAYGVPAAVYVRAAR